MLIAVERSSATELLERLEQHKTPVAARIGEVIDRRGVLIEVVS
jgi:hydrogenase maturation factor